jgi:acyl dehydratase
MPAKQQRFFEEFAVGQKFRSGTATVTAQGIKAFAADFDPQVFHLDEEAAKNTLFAGLAASGWHTAAIAMRLFVESDLQPAGGTIGAGVEDLRWPKPVRPGDVLHVEGEVTDARASRSRPDLGIVKLRATAFNQLNEPVQIWTPVLMVRRRPPGGDAE